jgi:hypothetical protein
MRRSRRAFLRAAAVVGSVGIAGCGDGENTVVTAPPGNNNGGGGGTSTATATGAANGTTTGTDDTPTATDTPVPVGSNETWGSFQFDLANTGSVPLNHSAFVSSQKNWSLTLDARPTMQPAFDEDQLYVPTRDSLHVIDRETQEVNWTFESPESPVTTPLVPGDGFVYVLSASGVYEIHAMEGWGAFTYNFSSEFKNLLGVSGPSAPILVGDTMVFNLVLKKTSGSRTTVSRLVGIDLSGDERWRTDKPGTVPALGLGPTPAASGDTLYVASGRDKQEATLYSVDAKNGNTGFATGYTGKGWSSVTLTDGQLFFADKYADVFTTGGNKVVRRTLDPPPNAYACAAGSDLVFMSSRTYGGNKGRLFAINERGTAEWTFEGEGNLYVPTTTENSVYVVSASGSLFALDQADGRVRWTQDLGLSGQVVASAPVISTDEIYLTATTGNEPAKLISISPTR